MKNLIISKLAMLAAAGGLLLASCITDVADVDKKPVRDGSESSVTFEVNAPSSTGTATRALATRAARTGSGNAHFPDGVPADYRNYNDDADVEKYGRAYGGYPDAEAEQAAFERAVAAMSANYAKSPAAKSGLGAGQREGDEGKAETSPATRAIAEGSIYDNMVDEITILVFDATDDGYVKMYKVGGPGQSPEVSDFEQVPGNTQRWRFTLNDLKDGKYKALFIANSGDRIAALGGEDWFEGKTIDQVRSTLTVGHTLSNTNKWNASPQLTDGTRNPDWEAFPMSSKVEAFTIPDSRDYARRPIQLMRAVAKINIHNLLPKNTFEITKIRVYNHLADGRTIPLEGWPSAVNPAGPTANNTNFLEYTGSAIVDNSCIDQIYVYEQAALNPASPDRTNWGMENLCLTIQGQLAYPSGSNILNATAIYRVDLLKSDPDNSAANPLHIDVVRNYTYDVVITDITAAGHFDHKFALQNPPSGLEFEIDAWDTEDPNGGMVENTYNGSYQLTVDRSVLVLGPEQGSTASVRVFTDHDRGIYGTQGLRENSSNDPAEFTLHPYTATDFYNKSADLTVESVGHNNTGDILVDHLCIRAGELLKIVTIVQLPHSKNVTGQYTAVTDYVGAFWRADQTGERLIRLKNNKNWAAFVLDGQPEGSGDWVVMDGKPSTDSQVGTDSPALSGNDAAFDRNHKVGGSSNWAVGKTDAGGGYLRLGARNYHAATDEAPARYATVILVEGDILNSNKVDVAAGKGRLLYLRQGDGADYLMRPEGETDATSDDRPLASRFSPYNLTAKAFTGAGSDTHSVQVYSQSDPNYAGAFADYPTQAGGQFQWAPTYGLYAFNPGIASGTVVLEWQGINSQDNDVWADYNGKYESCPPGYRRPTQGDTSAYEVETVVWDDSEMYQSLFSKTGGGANTSVWGFYADGFFDRRHNGTATGVKAGNSAVAYRGRLFYNTTTRGSLFFPAGGVRMAEKTLVAAGDEAHYWSSTSSPKRDPLLGERSSWDMTITATMYLPSRNIERQNASSIRCVVATPDFIVAPNEYNWEGYEVGETFAQTITYTTRYFKTTPMITVSDLPAGWNVTSRYGVVKAWPTAPSANYESSVSATATLTATDGTTTLSRTVTLIQRRNVPLASPGMIGYTKDTRELTLSGSKEYKGTPVDNAQTREQFGPLSDQTVFAAYFKWGSLIAVGSENNGPFSEVDIIEAPSTPYKGLAALKSEIGALSAGPNAWNGIPYNYYAAPADGWAVGVGGGLGDPCSYYFDGFRGGDWRTPVGGSANGGWNRGTFGSTAAGGWNNAPSGSKWIDNNVAEYSMIPVDGAVAGNGDGTQNWSMFLPAAGHRSTMGEIGAAAQLDPQGTNGYYWSSTVSGSANARELNFMGSLNFLYPVAYNSRNGGEAIRCVAAPPEIVVNPSEYIVEGYEVGESYTQTITYTTRYFETTPTITVSNLPAGWNVTVTNGLVKAWPLGINSSYTKPVSVTVTLTATDGITSASTTVTLTQRRNVPLASPGVIGYIKGTNTLTLNGSKEYKGTLVDPAVTPRTDGITALENKTVYVAYFKWGSLIAVGSENNGPFSEGDIIAAPTGGYKGLALLKEEVSGMTPGNDAWGGIPYSLYNGGLDCWPLDMASGFGDPCDYYFGDGDGDAYVTPSAWRVPAGGPSSPAGWYAAGGAPFGEYTIFQDNWKLTNGAMWIDNANDPYKDLPIDGAVAGKNGDQDWSMFLPAAGNWSTSGKLDYDQGKFGSYWSATPGRRLNIRISQVDPDSFSADRWFGMAVRCVPN